MQHYDRKSITEVPNESTRQDSQVQLQEIADILHGAGTDDEKIILI